MQETVAAYAKINLHLDVTAKRADGFHDIRTIMQTVSLCDTVKLTLTADGKITVRSDVPSVPLGNENIAYRAAKLFFEVNSLSSGVEIEIKKRIPMAAGLAGGSTDAAAVLVGLNRLCGRPMQLDRLLKLGAALGSDVPFCILGGAAYGEGRGEVLTSLKSMPTDMIMLVAVGGEGVSTPWAYRLLDNENNNFYQYIPHDKDTLEKALTAGDREGICKHLFNIFEQSVVRERPTVATIKRLMLDGGASAAIMSGSGPSVFGIFNAIEYAETTREMIEKLGYFCSVVYPTEKNKA